MAMCIFAQPPLYKLAKGKEVRYVYSDQERDAVLAAFTKKKTAKTASKKKAGTADAEDETKTSGVSVQRYKGLGEMNFEELRDTTMNTENRVLKRVSIEDAEHADRTFDMLMGSEVAPRKAFIQENATYATLDV